MSTATETKTADTPARMPANPKRWNKAIVSKTRLQAPVSVFANGYAKHPCRETTIADFIRATVSGEDHAALVDEIRAATDKPSRDRLKMKLPAVTLSGSIEGMRAEAMAEGRLKHSGWLQIDLDAKDITPRSPEEIRELLAADPHILASWLSPSGAGAKALMAIPVCDSDEEHKAAFLAAQNYFLTTYSLKIDASTKDSNRLCFMSADADLNISSPLPMELDIAAHSPKPEPKPSAPIAPQEGLTAEDVREMLACIPPRPPYEEWLKIASAVWDALGEIEGTAALCEWSPEEHAGEYERKHAHRLERVTAGSLVHIAQANGWKRRKGIVKGLFRRDDQTPQEAEVEERTPFPMAAIPGAAGEMAREIGKVTTSQCDSLAAAAVLGTISASIGAGLEVSTGGERRTRGNLFVLAIADSGTGKGEAFSLAAKPFEELEAQEIERFDSLTKPRLLAKIKVAESRATMLCKVAAKENDEHARLDALIAYQNAEEELAALRLELQTAPRWKVSDVTKESLGVIMRGQPGEAVSSMSSEARGVFSIVKGRYGKEGGDEDFYCSGYSGDGVTFDRVSRERVILKRPCLSILWMVQPDAARKAFGDETMRESGLLPRFLIFDPKAEAKERFETPQPIPSATKAAWERLIAELVETYRQNGSEPRTISASEEAIAILNDYERENVRRRSSKGDLRDLKSFVARWSENAWRMAVVLHAAKHGSKAQAENIECETAENAVKIMRWFCDSQLESLASGRIESLRKRLLALLAVLAEANGEISFRDLRRSHSFESDEIKQLEGAFPNSFRVVHRKPDTGRPSWVVSSLLEDKKKV